jgi:drug/metabolite transporter (DMT)-like permease
MVRLYFTLKDYKLIFAVLTVALVWGTTFLAIRVAVETIPAWFVAGIRQFLASVIMFLFLFRERNSNGSAGKVWVIRSFSLL